MKIRRIKNENIYELSIKYRGRNNGITFEICDNNDKWYVLCEITKNTDICYNTLWGDRLEFDTIEESVKWCENLTQEELIKLREKDLKR